MTAAPRMVDPSRERSAPSSISVCAEMLTLVAVRIAPTKIPCQYRGRPNATATAAPPTNGSTTPPNADHNATLPTRRSPTMSVSRPATNMRRTTPISDRSRSTGRSAVDPAEASAGVANTGHPSMFRTVGPRTRPMRISPKTAGCPTRFASAPASLAALTTTASSSSSCRTWLNRYASFSPVRMR